jgi:hypothetical protein
MAMGRWASREIEIGPTGPCKQVATAAKAAQTHAPVQGTPALGVYNFDTLITWATLADTLRSTCFIMLLFL